MNKDDLIKKLLELKSKHPDAVILFRVGDFYESYCEDAQKISKVLGVTLTKDKERLADYTIFPCQALDTYLPKLIRAGVRVAICDNIENAQKAKDIAEETHQDEYVEYEEIKTEEPQQEEKEPTETKSAKIIYPDKESEDCPPKNGSTFELEELQEVVGGYIEIIRLNDGRLIIVNEEGLLHGLPVNIEATNILRRDHSTAQYIVGNAIVCDADMVE